MTLRFEIAEEGSRYSDVVYNWKFIVSDENGEDNLIVKSTEDYKSEEECLSELALFVDIIEEKGVDMFKDLLRRRNRQELIKELLRT